MGNLGGTLNVCQSLTYNYRKQQIVGPIAVYICIDQIPEIKIPIYPQGIQYELQCSLSGATTLSPTYSIRKLPVTQFNRLDGGEIPDAKTYFPPAGLRPITI